jgi:hypothetical protein
MFSAIAMASVISRVIKVPDGGIRKAISCPMDIAALVATDAVLVPVAPAAALYSVATSIAKSRSGVKAGVTIADALFWRILTSLVLPLPVCVVISNAIAKNRYSLFSVCVAPGVHVAVRVVFPELLITAALESTTADVSCLTPVAPVGSVDANTRHLALPCPPHVAVLDLTEIASDQLALANVPE